jgi:hypothetical protein
MTVIAAGGFAECTTCGQYVLHPHTCPPAWLVWDPENGDEEGASRYYAYDPGVAVEHWAANEDSHGDYLIVQGATVTVLARLADSDEPVRSFKVTGESVPSYTATETERILDAPP